MLEFFLIFFHFICLLYKKNYQFCTHFLVYIWVRYALKVRIVSVTVIQNNSKYQQGEVILVDKPLTWTSFDVVNKLRRAISIKLGVKKIKVGHAGTLDPLATGLVIVCTGKKTKEIETYQAQEKEYIATLALGATTPSYDLETEIDQRFPTEHITLELIQEKLALFIGEIDQVPPVFSAIKQDGKRAYEKARAGKAVEMKSRKVTIHEIELIKFQNLELTLRIVCSKGTYIRSLAYDMGKALDSGAHLSALRRTAIGDFSINSAYTIDSFLERLESEDK